MRSPRTAKKSSLCSRQLEKARVQQRRPNTVNKNKKKINTNFFHFQQLTKEDDFITPLRVCYICLLFKEPLPGELGGNRTCGWELRDTSSALGYNYCTVLQTLKRQHPQVPRLTKSKWWLKLSKEPQRLSEPICCRGFAIPIHLHVGPSQDLLAGVVHPEVGSPLADKWRSSAWEKKENNLVINTLFCC